MILKQRTLPNGASLWFFEKTDGTFELQRYVWPGGYPLAFLDKHNTLLCYECAQMSVDQHDEDVADGDDGACFVDDLPVSADVLWEGEHWCDCGKRMEVACPDED